MSFNAEDEQKLWDYYAAAAKKLGRKQLENDKDGPEQNYSVRWYFDEHSPEKNILTRAFLGDKHALALVRRAILGQASPEELNELYDGRGSAQYDENDFLEGAPQPDDAQKDAIRAALTMPISFIKGPPGTGKTSAILHLLSCILQQGKKQSKKQGKTAAMVSSNNTAIQAVTNKLDTYRDSAQPKQSDLYNAFARLGNSKCRAKFEQAHPEPFAGEYKTCSAMPSEDFLRDRPIIASTIYSLPKCFSDWKKNSAGRRREPVYDYVIVDESSQVNALLGLIAMGGARHLVLVGDDDQLPPVTDEKRIKAGTAEKEEKAAAVRGFEDIYALREDRSFLWACKEVFLGDDEDLDKKCSKMLNFHYRCHPGIIGFCRQEVYNHGREKLEIRTRDYDRSHTMPIRVVWFEGEFCEKVQRETENARGGEKTRRSKCNRRQSEIFMQEEWPGLLDRLCADPCSVLGLDMEGHRPFRFGVLSPFKGQLWDLRDRLVRWLNDNQEMIRQKADSHRQALLALVEDVGVKTCLEQNKRLADQVRQASCSTAKDIVDFCVRDFPDRLRPLILGEDTQTDSMEVVLPELTIHKAQGQEYDVVYFLPVDDLLWEWPWSQKKRLINVAVSRAKRELRIIVSSALMSENIQKALVGEERVVPPWSRAKDSAAEDGGDEDEAFLRRLIDYVWENGPNGPGPWTDGPFGFHRTCTRSLFDRTAAISWRRSRRPGMKKPYPFHYPSAPEICFQDWLSHLPLAVDNALSLYIDVPIDAVTPQPELPEDTPDRSELTDYIGNGAHFDCVICRGEQILMVVEVDGEYHRIDPDCRENDAKKDRIVARGFGAAMYAAKGGDAVLLEDSAPVGSSSFTFLRLPTDGTTWDEEKTIERLLAERLRSKNGPVYTLPVRTLAKMPADWKSVFPVLSCKQDWNTGLPVRANTPGADKRWIPRKLSMEKMQELGMQELDMRQVLIMSYLPDKGDYWKKERRLRPGMVCLANGWENLAALAQRQKEKKKNSRNSKRPAAQTEIVKR